MYRIINDTAVDEKTTTLIKDYVGLSTDTKPTDVGAGSTFIEGDTQTVYIFDGTTWRAF